MTPPFHSPSSGHGVAAALRALADLVDAEDPAELSDGLRTEVVLAAVRVSGQVDALMARAVGVFDANTVWAGDGARSCSGWLSSRTELKQRRAAGIVATARDLRACPVVEMAWREGRIGTDKVRLLLEARLAWPERFAEAEADLVRRIEDLRVEHAAVVMARWTALAEAAREADQRERAGDDPDGVPEPDPVEGNRLHLSKTLGGRWIADGEFDPVTGTAIEGRIAAWIDRQFDQGTYRADDGMTLAQRRSAALDALTERGALPGQTKHGDPRPSVAIHIDARTLYGEVVADLDDMAARCCSLDDGTPVTRMQAERLLCGARVAAMLVRIGDDGAIETLGVTDLLRDATRKQRRALRLRDGGCVFPGCAAPPDWCEAHHLIEWEHFGPTLVENLALLCSHHHHLVHEGGWRLWRSVIDGQLHLAKPGGTPVAMAPHGSLVDPDAAASPERPPPRPTRTRFETRRERHQREHERRSGLPPDLPPDD